ncbi:MAG: signal peptidase I [Nitrospirota bacterium]
MKCFLWITLMLHLPLASWAEVKEYTVAGDSMSPALVSGDKVIVDTDAKDPVQRGDLVAISFTASPVPMVKRAAAIPGDRVEFRDNAAWVNGQKVREIDRQRWQSTIKQIEHFGNRIPEGYYLILGDNPRNSRDSGRLGLISSDHIKGRVVSVVKSFSNNEAP